TAATSVSPRSLHDALPISAFALIGRATWWMGGLFGLLHGLAALTVIVPLLPGVHPRMASERTGPELRTVLEPPGPLGLNYGGQRSEEHTSELQSPDQLVCR